MTGVASKVNPCCAAIIFECPSEDVDVARKMTWRIDDVSTAISKHVNYSRQLFDLFPQATDVDRDWKLRGCIQMLKSWYGIQDWKFWDSEMAASTPYTTCDKTVKNENGEKRFRAAKKTGRYGSNAQFNTGQSCSPYCRI
ncbi:hypothetical protein CHU98_g1049 [Xylaria longipes]|nr:hypothetical protein CHU98_g1049 [Xylaria longipes]